MAGGDATEYLNVPNQFMKDCVKQILVEQGIPVWFGADCHPFMDRENGAWATDLFEYGRVYDVDFDLDKEARVRFGDSAMNHASLCQREAADRGRDRGRRPHNNTASPQASPHRRVHPKSITAGPTSSPRNKLL